MSVSSSLPEVAPDVWARATNHPFVDAIGKGSLPAETFRAWIQQDYHFCVGLGAFVRTLTANAPPEDRAGLRTVVTMLEPEYDLFRQYARRERFGLETERIPECTAYLAFLNRSAGEGYDHGLVAYYGCQRSLFEAWKVARDSAGFPTPYAEWVENWSSTEYGRFVDWVGQRVDAAVPQATDELNEVFVGALQRSIAFWDAFV